MKQLILILFLKLLLPTWGRAASTTDTLSFVFEGKRYSGLLEMPGSNPAGLVVIVPGSGKTNVVDGNWFAGLRRHFAEAGFASYVWDRAGCGKSEGVFDGNQPVQNSAQEAIAAIEELKSRRIPGAEKTGLWSLSRGGWICPLVIAGYPTIAFWISVSGPDDKETFGYLLETNFRIEGRSKKETKKLMKAWYANMETARHGATWEENQKATECLRNDSFYVYITNGDKPTKENYLKWQKSFETGEQMPVDEKTGLPIYIPGFDKILNKVNCPVLAIFGEKDSQVDWRKTMKLYRETIGKNPGATLTIKTFPNGNHSIQQCKTGGYREHLEKRELCEGYYETITTWLREKALTK